MGQRGAAPAPVALKILRGETRPVRLNKAPQSQDPPAMPDDLAPDAAKLWTSVLAATALTSHIGQGHAEAFRQYCEVTAAANAMRPKGTREWQNLVLVSLKLARELCLTPATGAGLRGSKTAVNPLDKYRPKTG